MTGSRRERITSSSSQSLCNLRKQFQEFIVDAFLHEYPRACTANLSHVEAAMGQHL